MVLQLTRATKTKVLYFQFLAFLMFIFLIHAGLQAAVQLFFQALCGMVAFCVNMSAHHDFQHDFCGSGTLHGGVRRI